MPTNRFSLIIALGAIAVLGLFTISMVAQPHSALSSSPNAYLQQRQGEWTAGVSSEQAYLEQRQGEQTTGHAVNAQQAYQEFRHGEQMTGVNPVLVYLEFRRGEWSGK